MWSLGAGICNRWEKKQNPSHTFSSFLPSPITQSRADRRRCSPAFSTNACVPGPAAAGGFGPGCGLCLRANHCIQSAHVGLCVSLSFSLLPRSQLMKRCPLEHSKPLFFSPHWAPNDSLASHFVLQFSLAVDISFLVPDSVTRGNPATFPESIKLSCFSIWQAWMQGK